MVLVSDELSTMRELSHLPRYRLGFFPTPVVHLKRLSDYLNGPQIWMKRDDQTGLALGGNKTRKLEFAIGAALAEGADTVVTGGAAQSNHCRQTAAAAAMSHLDCHLALGGTAPKTLSGNLLLDRLFGAHIHWSGDQRKGETIPTIVEDLKRAGKTPYVIPYGGSNAVGALGFVEAAHELAAQLSTVSEPITHIAIASSSGGTQAGLMLGKHMIGADWQVVGIDIDKGQSERQSFAESIVSLASATAELLDYPFHFSDRDLILNSDYVGAGYGIVGDLEREAIALVAQLEGILLDPVYTGRAMGALIDMVRNQQFSNRDRVLFWHTGGTPALFAYASDLVPE